jgi:hypothetical protein
VTTQLQLINIIIIQQILHLLDQCVCVHMINDFIYSNWHSPYWNIFDYMKYVI